MMKTIACTISSILLAMSASVFAEKVIITGEPVIMAHEGDVYTLPKDYVTTESYYYVSVDGTKRVCYLEKQPTLASLDILPLSVSVGGKTVQWSCYPFDDTYFSVGP